MIEKSSTFVFFFFLHFSPVLCVRIASEQSTTSLHVTEDSGQLKKLRSSENFPDFLLAYDFRFSLALLSLVSRLLHVCVEMCAQDPWMDGTLRWICSLSHVIFLLLNFIGLWGALSGCADIERSRSVVRCGRSFFSESFQWGVRLRPEECFDTKLFPLISSHLCFHLAHF